MSYSSYTWLGEYILYDVPDDRVDAGEDQSVIIHEYGHALHDALIGDDIGNPNPNFSGISEGIGFYLGISYRRTVSDFLPNEASNWYDPGKYQISESLRYPDDWVGYNYHEQGEVWASMLMDIEEEISRDVATTLMLQSIHYVDRNMGPTENAEAIVFAENELYGGNYHDTIINILRDRGFFNVWQNITSDTE